jgi:hypothetical protein
MYAAVLRPHAMAKPSMKGGRLPTVACPRDPLFCLDPAARLVDPAHFDLHLLPGAPALDTGSSVNAPKLDRDRIPRPQGKGIDIGAYEWHTDDVRPVEGT